MAVKIDNEKERDCVQIYSDDCRICSHFILGEPGFTAFQKCHFSKGNRFCPAQGVGLVVVGEAYALAEQVHEARDKRDAATEAKIMARVAKKNEYFRERFYWAIENRTEFERTTNKVN